MNTGLLHSKNHRPQKSAYNLYEIVFRSPISVFYCNLVQSNRIGNFAIHPVSSLISSQDTNNLFQCLRTGYHAGKWLFHFGTF
jgi:hypothetical protein